MDADDEKHIKEQLQLVGNNQQAIQHATKKQLNIIHATIAHIQGDSERPRCPSIDVFLSQF